MLVQLGSFLFSLDSLPYNEIERISRYTFAHHEVIGNVRKLQGTGVENDTLRLTGTHYAELSMLVGVNANPFDELREIAETLEPQLLTSADGLSHGYWVIIDINQKGSYYNQQGAQRTDFNIQLLYYGPRAE